MKHFPAIILSAFLARLLYTGASVGDSIVILSLGALYAGCYFLESKKEPVANKELVDRLVEAEQAILSIRSKVGANDLLATRIRR